MLQDRVPVRELRAAEPDPLAPEMVRTVIGAVVNEVSPLQETLSVAEDKPLLEIRVQVHLHPVQLVAPGGRVVPGGGGQEIDVVLLFQLFKGLQCAGHRIHQGEHPGSVLGMRRKALQHLSAQAVYSGVEIHQDTVHVHIKGLFYEPAVFG